MTALAPLAPLTTSFAALGNLVLVSPQLSIGYTPQLNGIISNNNNPSPLPTLGQNNIYGLLSGNAPSFLFNYEGEQSVSLESDITDHYIESNTPIQDQIAIRPEIITTHGFIGELTDIAPFFLQPLQDAVNKLTVIGAYTPELTITAQIAYNEAFQAYQIAQNAINEAQNITSTFSNILSGTNGESVIGANGLTVSGNQTKQQTAFQQFFAYQQAKKLFTVQTPWAVFQNMAIKTLKATQDADTSVITDFFITFKRIRTIDVDLANQKIRVARNAAQAHSVDLSTGNALGNNVSFNPNQVGGHAVQ